jgi:GPH family glycoside/pentoside/hexuronide:cation symporter
MEVEKMKLTIREKLSYGTGDLACGLMFNTITLYLMFFYTDIFGITAAAAGTLLMVARILDGVWDLCVGVWVDRSRSRFGRCRPFLLYGAPVLVFFSVACFYVPTWESGDKLIYAYVSYIGLMLAYSIVNVPYGAMPVLMTSDPNERTSLAGVRMACANIGWIVVGGATLPLIAVLGGEDKQLGYLRTMGVFGFTALLMLWLCFANTAERVAEVPAKQELGPDLKALFGSRAWKVLAISLLFVFIAVLMPASVAIYYFTYLVEDPDKAPVFFVLGNLGNLLGIATSAVLTRRFCKRQVLLVATFCFALCSLVWLVVDPHSNIQVFGAQVGLSFLAFISVPILVSMTADTADSIELATGRRVVGLAASSLALAMKFGMGVGAGIVGGVLAYTGYKSGLPQEPAALQGIQLCLGLGPALAMLASFLVMNLYPLNRTRLSEMQIELAHKRAETLST